MTRYVTCSVPRPARGVFLHHDGHAAGGGSADLKGADQTGGGGGGSGTGSRVSFPDQRERSRSKRMIDSSLTAMVPS